MTIGLATIIWKAHWITGRLLYRLVNMVLLLFGLRWFDAGWDLSPPIRLIDVLADKDISFTSVKFLGPSRPGQEFNGTVTRVYQDDNEQFPANPKTGEPYFYKFAGRFRWEDI